MAIEYGDGTDSNVGRIIQVVNFRKGDHASATINGSNSGSSDWNYTGFSPAITPLVADSKILMTGHLSIGGDETVVYIEVMVNGSYSTGGPQGDANGNRRSVHTASSMGFDRNPTTVAINYVFTPGTTSTQTYNFRINHDSANNRTFYFNRGRNNDNNQRQGDAISHITLMEIAV